MNANLDWQEDLFCRELSLGSLLISENSLRFWLAENLSKYPESYLFRGSFDEAIGTSVSFIIID